jgi:nitrogen fixation/metabolism regulation signal transduction histidine kinase
MTVHRFAGAIQKLVTIFLVLILIGITAAIVMYLSDESRPMYLVYITIGLAVSFLCGLVYVIGIPIYQTWKQKEVIRAQTAAKIRELTTINQQDTKVDEERLSLEDGSTEKLVIPIINIPGTSPDFAHNVLERYCSIVSQDYKRPMTTL